MNLHEFLISDQCDTSQGKGLQNIITGFAILTRISAMPGSPVLSFAQPLIVSRLFQASWVLLGSQILLLLAKHIFHLEKLPVLDLAKGQKLQIPIEELQNLIQYLGTKQSVAPSNQGAAFNNTFNRAGELAYPTELPPDSPIYAAVFISVDYTDEVYTPTLLVYIPILSFPGLRGALPFLILALLAVILVRCVVPPETTGAKPVPKPRTGQNQSFNLSSEDVMAILRRFGSFFSSP